MDAGPTPAVIGPGPAIYIVDDHHTLCGLDYSGYVDTSVTFNILCDMRDVSVEIFWEELERQNLAYLVSHPKGNNNGLPIQITYNELPNTFSFNSTLRTLSDDPWRSLAGYSRKVQDAAAPAPSCSSSDSKYCERCMYRGCVDGYQKSGGGVAYFEFRWAYFMNDAAFYTTSLWPSTAEKDSFLQAYSALPESVMGKVNTSSWLNTASLVISLCRASSAGSYRLSTAMFPGTDKLPGYMQGYVKLADDPSCSAPTCAAKYYRESIKRV
jgi:hypothetical protein